METLELLKLLKGVTKDIVEELEEHNFDYAKILREVCISITEDIIKSDLSKLNDECYAELEDIKEMQSKIKDFLISFKNPILLN